MRHSALCSNHKTSSMNPGGFIQLTAKPQKNLGTAAMASAGGWGTHCMNKQRRAGRARGLPGDEGRGLPLGSWPALNQQHAAFGVKYKTSLGNRMLCAPPEHLPFFGSDLEAYFLLLWHCRHCHHLGLMLHRENAGPCCEVCALDTINSKATRQMFG